MKYFSEVLNKVYDSQEECEEAENKVIEARAKAKEEKEKLTQERKARADEVEEARKAMLEAQKNYKEILNKFLADYKTYHYSSSNINDIPSFFEDWDWIFRF